MTEGRWAKDEGRWTREPATHKHNEILANKTILTLNLKQVARSRRRRRDEGRRTSCRQCQCQRQDQPQKHQRQIQNRIYYTYIPMEECLPPLLPVSIIHYRVRLSNIYSLDWIAGFTY